MLPLNLIAVGDDNNQTAAKRPNGYPAFHLMFTTSGKGFLKINGVESVIPENSCFVLKPHQPHEYYPAQGKWHTHWIVFTGGSAHEIMEQFGLFSSLPPSTEAVAAAARHHQHITLLAKKEQSDSAYNASSALYDFLSELSFIFNFRRSPDYGKHLEKIRGALIFIHQNYNKDLSLDDIAERCGYTRQYINRLFFENLRISPYRYLIDYRLKKAKELLSNKDLSIEAVSRLVGFNDFSYFCSVFKKHEKTSPLKFRSLF